MSELPEEFFVLPFLGFIPRTGRARTIVLGVLSHSVATTLALSSYPFDPLPVIGAIFLILFFLVGTTVVIVFADMHRDATLDQRHQHKPGELGFDCWTKVVAFGIGPLMVF